MPATSSHPLQIEHLGEMIYADAHELQKRLHSEVATGIRPPTLLLLEHPRTITFGISNDRSHLNFPESYFADRGVALHATERGGKATYHGPGQLVGYPIVPMRQKVGDYLRHLEAILLEVVAGYGIEARGNPGYAGLWVDTPEGEKKLAAIGIAVRQRTAFHGFALNVDPDLSDFDLIVPCGMPGQPVTSLKQLLGAAPSMEEVALRVASVFQDRWPSMNVVEGE